MSEENPTQSNSHQVPLAVDQKNKQAGEATSDQDELAQLARLAEEIGVRSDDAKLLRVLAQFSGPMPPPSMVLEYDQIYPGAAAKFIDNVLQESTHRRELQRLQISGAESRLNRGQLFGFLFAAIGVSAAIGLPLYNSDLVYVAIAILFVTAGVSGLPTITRLILEKFEKRM